MKRLDITPPPTVTFPEGIKLVRAELVTLDELPPRIQCTWEANGRPKYSHALAPPMMVLTDPAYWSMVVGQLQTHMEAHQ